MAGDPVNSYLSDPERASPRQIQEVIERFGLDQPLYMQYLYWLKGLLQGDLGYSQVANLPVTDAIALKFPATFEIAILATFVAVIVGIAAGTRSAVKANSAFDQTTRVTSLVAVSIPVFWLGLILLKLFYADLGWFPAPDGRTSLEFSDVPAPTNFKLVDSIILGRPDMFWDALLHLVLPAITLAFASTAIIVRMMRSSMLEVLGAEYVRTARSKGLPEKVVIKRHARRNALIPTTTVVGLSFGGLLGGAVLTETIFNWPGMGRWSADAALNLDTAGIMGFTLLVAVIYVLANLTVDIMYAYLDPRVRLG